MTDKNGTSGKAPASKIRINGCAIAIWANRNERGVHHSATFQRSYKDEVAIRQN